MDTDRIARHVAWTADLDSSSSEEDSIVEDEAVVLFMDLVTASNQSSDDFTTSGVTKRGGSKKGRRANIDRNRQTGRDRLFADCFAAELFYDDLHFWRRFRMPYGVHFLSQLLSFFN